MQHCCDSMIMWIYLLLGSNFHRNSLERERGTVPVNPTNSFACRSVCATEVQSIQVCEVTPLVPPASLTKLCTAHTTQPVIVSVRRAERHAVMIAERITWNTHNVTYRIVNPEDTKCAWPLSCFHFVNNGDNCYINIFELNPCCDMASLTAAILHTAITLATFHYVLLYQNNLEPEFQQSMRRIGQVQAAILYRLSEFMVRESTNQIKIP